MRSKSNENTQTSDTVPVTKPQDTVRINPLAATLFTILLALAIGGAIYLDNSGAPGAWMVIWLIITLVPAFYLLSSLKIASQWEKVVVLRMGKFRGLRGPGLFWIVPLIDSTPSWIDHRVMVTPFNAEKTLTKDTMQLITNRA